MRACACDVKSVRFEDDDDGFVSPYDKRFFETVFAFEFLLISEKLNRIKIYDYDKANNEQIGNRLTVNKGKLSTFSSVKKHSTCIHIFV